jgi:predicted RND superfamily exporter protein
VGDAQQGVVFSLLFAFFVLLVTTQNIIVSILSTYSISSIILQMMAMIHFNDWTFGIIQSICVIVFIGISVDYVAHIAHQFVHTTQRLRRERTKEAYRQMGQTILGGALTSIFAGVFLVFCNVAILSQFGILFITTIIASFFTAVIFFPSILFILGPDHK